MEAFKLIVHIVWNIKNCLKQHRYMHITRNEPNCHGGDLFFHNIFIVFQFFFLSSLFCPTILIFFPKCISD